MLTEQVEVPPGSSRTVGHRIEECHQLLRQVEMQASQGIGMLEGSRTQKPMIIIAGYSLTEAADRDAALVAFQPMVERARREGGCIDLHVIQW